MEVPPPTWRDSDLKRVDEHPERAGGRKHDRGFGRRRGRQEIVPRGSRVQGEFGGPWDLVTTYNWDYNPVYNWFPL